MFKPLSSITSSTKLEDTKHAISDLKRHYDASSDEETTPPPQKISKVSSSSGFQFVNMCKPNSKFFFHSGSFSSSGGGSSGTEYPNLNNDEISDDNSLDGTESKLQSPPTENKSEETVPLFRGDSLETDISVGVFEALGKRKSMEDRHDVVPFANSAQSVTETQEVNHEPENYAFFAIYDGHGGTAAADYVQANLHKKIISQSYFKTDPERAIREGMKQTEQDFMDKAMKENIDGLTGTTVCVALIHGNVLYAANVGDSAIILCRHGKVLKLTNPHTPKNPAEKARVLAAGGVIVKDRLGHPHWNANLINVAVTRAFGDIYFKAREYTEGKPSGLSAEPELTKITLTFGDEFILLASDGFWDVVTPREAIEYVKERPKVDPSIICKELTDLALRRSTMDNTTVLLVRLHSNQNHVDSERTEHKHKNDSIKS